VGADHPHKAQKPRPVANVTKSSKREVA